MSRSSERPMYIQFMSCAQGNQTVPGTTLAVPPWIPLAWRKAKVKFLRGIERDQWNEMG